MFLRRLPEAVEEQEQLPITEAEPKHELAPKQEFFENLGRASKSFSMRIVRPIWHFMLEAKDLKEGRILASKVAEFVRPGRRVINIGAFSTLKKAERLVNEEKYAQAEVIYYDVIKKHPQEYGAYEGLVKVFAKQKRHDEVIETLIYLLKHNPDNDRYLAQIGFALMSQKRWDDAIEAYEKSIEVNSLVPTRFMNLGLSYQAKGDWQKASQNFKRAVDLEPANMQYLMKLIDAYEELGLRTEAIAELRRALGMDPANEAVRQRLKQFENYNH